MAFLIDAAIFLFGMGFTQVVVKPIAVRFFRATTSAILPKLFDRLDPVLPESILRMDSEQLKKRIYDTIQGVSNEEKITLSEAQKKALFEEFITLYNPLIACSKIP
jgi:hypothetical protein